MTHSAVDKILSKNTRGMTGSDGGTVVDFDAHLEVGGRTLMVARLSDHVYDHNSK